jgi:protein-tyrosine phosphatase
MTNSGAQHLDISQITENLYISSRAKGKYIEDVLQLDPDLIISMIFERRPTQALTEAGLQVLWLRTVDFVLVPIPLRTLKRGVEAALPVIQDGGRVLVFCQGGRHRSVALASAILIGLGCSADEAMQLVSSNREVADPYAWHVRRQIRRFEAYWLRHKNQEQ